MTGDIAAGTSIDEAGRVLDRDWLAVAAAMCGQILSIGTLTIYSFGVFIHSLHAEFGWSRTQLSVAVSISQYGTGLLSPFWGHAIDRFGPRMILVPTIVMLSIMVASLSQLTPPLWHLYLVFLLFPLLGPSSVLYPATMARLFNRRIGLAFGLSAMGVGLGGTILPPVAQALIASVGWRHAYLCLGLITVLVNVPMALIATRHVHGRVPGRGNGRAASILPLLRTRTFGLACMVFLLLGLITVGTLVHLVPLMTGRGFAPATAARLAGTAGLAALVSRAGIGWVLDHVQAPRVIATVTLVAVGALTLLGVGGGRGAYELGVLMLGGVIGAEVDFIGFVIRRYFPPAAFGRLFGILFMVFALGGGTGPILMGLSFDHLGGYRSGLMLFSALGLAAAAAALAIPRYEASHPLQVH